MCIVVACRGSQSQLCRQHNVLLDVHFTSQVLSSVLTWLPKMNGSTIDRVGSFFFVQGRGTATAADDQAATWL